MQKKNYTLYLNVIYGDFEPVEMVKRSIDSVKDYMDGIYATVTYTDKEPTDDSPLVQLLKEYKAHITFFKWEDNFASARQFAMEQMPSGEDIFFYWQDADDVLKGVEHIPQIMEDMQTYKQAAVFFPYWYKVELDKSEDIKEILINHKRERLIRNNHTWKWVGDLHETLVEQKHENLLRVGSDLCTVIQLSNKDREDVGLERNIRILEKQAKRENHKDPRTLVYLAKAYLDKARTVEEPQRKIHLDLALNLFHEYLEGSGNPGEEGYIEPSGWREERGTAWAAIGEIAIMTGHPDAAIGAYQNAIDEGYEFPNYYVDLAMAYCMAKDYKRAKHWLEVASHMNLPNTTIIVMPRDLKLRTLQVSMDINLHEQNLEGAKKDAEMILDIIPGNEDTLKQLATINYLIEYNKACQSFVYLGKYLEKHNGKHKLPLLVQSIPPDIQREQFASQMRHLYMPTKIWAENEIAIICGPSFEKWSPKSVQSGIGGSEEAVISMSKELTKLGWKVTVYADPREDAGNYDGVEYKDWYEINNKDDFNVLILWRTIAYMDLMPKAKFTMLWLHDVPANPDYTKERIDRIDKIAILSEYHKSLLRLHDNGIFRKMPDDKVFLTSNGIPPIEFEWKGNQKRVIYMSSPDRGLIYLLNIWPDVLKEVPDAQLHIFYGFDVFDALFHDNPGKMKWKMNLMKKMKEVGAIYHGRLGHNALHYEISRSGIWAYPTDFTEISCISAMKAQACGAIPVVTNFGALTETVKNGIKVDVDIQTEEGQQEYKEALINSLKNEKWQTETRKEMIPWARSYYQWSNVASTWDELFKINLQNPLKKLEV